MAFTLEQARRLKKVSRKQAAEHVGVNASTVWRWETGKSAPDSEQFRALCQFYGMSMDDVFVRKAN